MLRKIRYEAIMWINHFLKFIPGYIGCYVRRTLLPIKSSPNVLIWDNVQIDSPSKLIIGRNSSINRGCIINCAGWVEIGQDVLIGPNTIIYSQNHNFADNKKLINEQGYEIKKVTIRNNVWIGANVIILPGVTIEDNVVVAAGSIVTKNLEKNYLYIGSPAHKARKI